MAGVAVPTMIALMARMIVMAGVIMTVAVIHAPKSIAFSSEVDPVRVKKTRQTKSGAGFDDIIDGGSGDRCIAQSSH
jgi:hypothetical protein